MSGRGVGRLRALGKRARPGRAPDVLSPRRTVAPPEARELGPGPNARAAAPEAEAPRPRALDFDSWERSVNQQTRDLLDERPELRDALRRVDATTRRILTKCASPCIPDGATAEDIARVHTLLVRVRSLHLAQELLLREYFYARRNAFSQAIGDIERAVNPQRLEKLLKEAAARRAARFEELARRHRGLQDPPLQAGESPNAPGTFFPGRWGDPKAPPYEHARKKHRVDLNAEQNFDRARDPGRKGEKPVPQGQWVDDRFIVEAERRAVPANFVRAEGGRAVHEFDMGHPVGRVYLPDGTIVSDVTRVRVLRNADGSFFDAFPIVGDRPRLP